MDRYTKGSGGAARAFWLQAYQEDAFRQDRIGRGTTFVENLSVSILGGIQPARIKGLRDLTDDGLMQRLHPSSDGQVRSGRGSHSVPGNGAIQPNRAAAIGGAGPHLPTE